MFRASKFLLWAALVGVCHQLPIASAQDFEAILTGYSQTTPVETNVTGSGKFSLSSDGLELSYRVTASNPSGVELLGAAGAHFHCAPAGSNGPVVVVLSAPVDGGNTDNVLVLKGTITAANITDPTCGTTTSDLVDSIIAGNVYVNIHSTEHPPGEVRGQISNDITHLSNVLLGSQQVPPVNTTVRGTTSITAVGGTALGYDLILSNPNGVHLLGVAGAHIHCGARGTTGPVVAYLAQPVTGGVTAPRLLITGALTDDDILDASCGATLADLLVTMKRRGAYVNVHSTENPGGEVRGQI